MINRLCSILIICSCYSPLFAQDLIQKIDQRLFEYPWEAHWISPPGVDGSAYGVYHFRKSFLIDEIPPSFIIHISADNRYRLFVNGESVSNGPARGDILHWRYETIDIANKLTIGQNLIAAEVVNFGEKRPLSQMTYKTAFILQGNTEKESIVNTGFDNGWKVYLNEAYHPIKIDWRNVHGFYAASPTDSLIAANYPWNWEKQSYNDDLWVDPARIGYGGNGIPYGYHRFSGNSAWKLVPRKIPMMEESMERFNEVIRNGNFDIPAGFPTHNGKLVIPPRSSVKLLIDQKHLTKGYPEILFSKGKHSKIKITYAEALYDDNGNKGNRNELEGKYILGYYDIFYPDGGINRKFRPLWLRTFRFIELDIQTYDYSLEIDDLYNIYTGYPFNKEASFECSDKDLMEIFDVGWRTLRMCSDETYWDCPYYEQIQYAGDNLQQVLISQYVSGDDRLFKNSLELFDHSRISDGVTYSRYPSNIPQITPAYSLIWVLMVYEYFMLNRDDDFVKSLLPGVNAVLDFYNRYIDETGMPGRIPYTNHIEAKSGTPVYSSSGHLAQHALLYSYTLKKVSKIYQYYSDTETGNRYLKQATDINKATYEMCFDQNRGLFADSPEKILYTQHSNTLAILSDAVSEETQKEIIDKVLSDTTLTPSYLFFSFFVHEAMVKTGLGEKYIDKLDFWEHLIKNGLTTFPEFELESRSDCHAWSAHPTYNLLATVCGIRSNAPGFRKVIIEPNPGNLDWIKATMPHPDGNIRFEMKRMGDKKVNFKVILPPQVNGEFTYNGKTIHLEGKEQEFSIYK